MPDSDPPQGLLSFCSALTLDVISDNFRHVMFIETNQLIMFGIFSSKQVITFGSELAKDLNKHFPASLEGKGKSKVSSDRVARILEKIYASAQAFRDANKLGYYRKTRLSHAFKWQLIELGYSTAFVDMATEGLVVYLHKPTQATPAAIEEAELKRTRKADQRMQDGAQAKSSETAYSRRNPSPRYKELQQLYEEMHEHGEQFLGLAPEQTFPGLSLPPQAHRIKAIIDQHAAKRILDYGSGKGQQYIIENIVIPNVAGVWPNIQSYWGISEIQLYDPSYQPNSKLPSGAFDGVICTDVLEHCPEEDIPWIVDEIFSFARKFVYANVACYPAKKHLPNGENAHCTIRQISWWSDIFTGISKRHPGVDYEVWIQSINAKGEMTENVVRSPS